MISEAKRPALSESANRFSKFFDPKKIWRLKLGEIFIFYYD